jgi:hypothetical protein
MEMQRAHTFIRWHCQNLIQHNIYEATVITTLYSFSCIENQQHKNTQLKYTVVMTRLNRPAAIFLTESGRRVSAPAHVDMDTSGSTCLLGNQ